MSGSFVFDTETTALVGNSLSQARHQPHIIEFYGCIVDDEGAVVEEIDFLCEPGVPITSEITRITGIKPADVHGLPGFSSWSEKVRAMIEKSDRVVAHNLTFDMTMVDVEFARLGGKVDWPSIKTCTVEATEWLKGYRLSLSNLHDHLFGEKFEGAHRAKVDVMALVRCFNHLRKEGML